MTTNVGEKNWNLKFAEKLGKNSCVPLLEHAGGRDATKTGLSILKFSADMASSRPFGPKTLKFGYNPDLSSKTHNKIWK